MAHTIRTRYVNTGTDAAPNAAGGNGTTDVSDPGGTDPNRAYATLSACEAGQQGDISTATGTDEEVRVYCSGSKVDVTGFTISGWTTDATGFINIIGDWVGPLWDTAKYHLVATGAVFGVTLYEAYVQFHNVQIQHVYNGTANMGCINSNQVGTLVDSCYLKADSNASSSSRGIDLDSGSTLKLYNTIITGAYLAGVNHSGGTTEVYNCTVYGCTSGIRRLAGTVTARNCAIFNNGDDINGTVDLDYCAIDDADAQTHPVTESGGGANWTSDFVDAAGGDFTLKAGSGLIGTGLDDPGSSLYSDDICGDTRTSVWDVGADEYVADGGSIVPQAMHHYKMQRRGF